MRPALPLLVLIALAVVLFGACSRGGAKTATSIPTFATSETSDVPNPGNPGLRTTTLRYDGGSITVEVADTPETRAEGLADRDSLARDSGMLFDLGSAGTTSFWMKGMRFPLDMVWIDAEQRIVGVTADVQPQRGAPESALRLYPSPDSTRYVIELNAGVAGERGLAQGTQLAFTVP